MDVPPAPPPPPFLLPSSTSSSPLTPFPPLPMEMKEEILRFCDPSTLANTSLASMAFLEMSAPFLYRDIVVKGLEAAERLFCKKRRGSPTIDALLNLRQIRSFQFTSVQPSSTTRSPPTFSTDRFPGGAQTRLHVPHLIIRLDPEPWKRELREEYLSSHLLPRLDPVVVVIDGSPLPSNPSCPYGPASVQLRLNFLPWDNLESITFLVSSSSAALGRASFFRKSRLPRNLVVVYDLSRRPEGFKGDTGKGVLYDLEVCEEGGDIFETGNRLKEVVIRFGSLKEKDAFEEKLATSWTERLGLSEVECARRRRFMRFEVAEATTD